MSSLEDDPEEIARKAHKTVITPGPRDIFVDIDSPEDRERMLKILHVFSENKFDLHIYKSVPSKTPGHEHVYIHAPHDLDPIMRIALQAILSSDRKREALSLLRVINKSDRPPTCFFENDPDNPPPAKTPVLKKSAAPWKTTT